MHRTHFVLILWCVLLVASCGRAPLDPAGFAGSAGSAGGITAPSTQDGAGDPVTAPGVGQAHIPDTADGTAAEGADAAFELASRDVITSDTQQKDAPGFDAGSGETMPPDVRQTSCAPGLSECVSVEETRTCGADSTWKASVVCDNGCSNGSCRECVPGQTECATGQAPETCQASGNWSIAAPCPGACLEGVCVACTPGQTRCLSDSTEQLCGNDGAWGSTMTCPYVCTGGACSSNGKRVFVTSVTFVGGALGGLDGADAKCQELAAASGYGGMYRAWLSDSTGSPASRFSKDGGPYVVGDGGVAANNWAQLTGGVLIEAISVTETGIRLESSSPSCGDGPMVWTDTKPDGTLGDLELDCGDWSDATRAESWRGDVSSVTGWSSECDMGVSWQTACGARAALYCFEQ